MHDQLHGACVLPLLLEAQYAVYQPLRALQSAVIIPFFILLIKYFKCSCCYNNSENCHFYFANLVNFIEHCPISALKKIKNQDNSVVRICSNSSADNRR